jgi:NAD(P)-dependent dehydrogenase (short-subunit alcohol dehydrogenase family)
MQRPASPTGLLDFADRVVVLTGTSSGMGAAAHQLFLRAGATVHTVDVVSTSVPLESDRSILHRCDLGDRDAVDRLVGELPNRVDALVNCAGVPNGGRFSAEQVMRVNWLGLRHLTERLVDRMDDGAAVVHVASTAGRDWATRRDHHEALMAAASFDDGLDWVRANAEVIGDGYAFSKEAVQFYTLWRSVQLLPRGIRMNSICPGITDTSIYEDFRRGVGEDVLDHARAVAGRIASPDEMAPAMLFLADHASSSYINGVNLNIDRGTGAARTTDQSDPARIWGPAGS